MMNSYLSLKELQELGNRPCDLDDLDTRFHLWSLAEIMDRFSVAVAGNAMSTLGRLASLVVFEQVTRRTFDRAEVVSQFNEEVMEAFTNVRLSRVLREQMNRAGNRISQDDCGAIEIQTLLRELHGSFGTEFTSSWFLRISEERRGYYEQRTPLFGPEVASVFPSATKDISAAGRCLALDEWTACVFHLMRILEIGLHDLGRQVGLPESALELENWKVVIDLIEKQIRSLEQAPKSPTKSATLQFYSEAANSFRYFKDAWRNHVSHSRANYNEREAITIYNSVLALMQTLAKHSTSKGTS